MSHGYKDGGGSLQWWLAGGLHDNMAPGMSLMAGDGVWPHRFAGRAHRSGASSGQVVLPSSRLRVSVPDEGVGPSIQIWGPKNVNWGLNFIIFRYSV